MPSDWADKGFGEQKPHSGNCLAGLTLYGCTNGKPHCREYVEIQLAEPLVPGQRYQVEFWVSHLKRSLQINNLGFFGKTRSAAIRRNPAVQTSVFAAKKVEAPGGKWVS
ncbi:MAG: hypothetical protein H6574_20130 [Lewinellaceae bacterium]|nr:hypothetical protein [Lewinellaceae bacterium]